MSNFEDWTKEELKGIINPNTPIVSSSPYVDDEEKGYKSIFGFIKSKAYDIPIDAWFRDIWYPLYNKKDVLITNNILLLIRNTTSMDKNFYIAFLIRNDIKFEIVKYYDEIVKDYPLLKKEIQLYSKENLAQKSWIKIPADNFKESILLMDNANIRRYFIMVEKILFDYTMDREISKREDLIIDNNRIQGKLVLKEKENQDLKKKISLVNNMVVERGNIMRTQIFYIATSKSYCKDNIFKIGGVENKSLIKSRFNTYNTERPKNDAFYCAAAFSCHDYKLVENFILSYFGNFKLPNKKELLRINFKDLAEVTNKIINHLNEYVSYFNCNQQRFVDNLINPIEAKENNEILNYSDGIWLSTKNQPAKYSNDNTNDVE